MSLVKQEDMDSDEFLAYWSEPKEDVKKAAIKLDLVVKSDIEDDCDVPIKKIRLRNESMLSNRVKSKSPEDGEMSNARSGSVKQASDIIKIKASGIEKSCKSLKVRSRPTTVFHNGRTYCKDLENAPVSDSVANLCKYQCKKCHDIFSSRYLTYKHFRETKHAESNKINISNYVISAVAHKCQICSKKLLCDKMCIQFHLRRSHQMNFKKYIQNENVKYDMSRVMFSKNFDIPSAKVSENPKVVRQVTCLCKFSCIQCHYSCKRWRKMLKHINDTHDHGLISSIDKYLTYPVFHKCIVCDKLLLCDDLIVGQHVQKHEMTLKAYKSILKPKNINALHSQFRLELKAACKEIPEMKAGPKCVLPPNTFENYQTTNSVGDLSFFKCPFCSKSNISYNCLRQHCTSKHKSKTFSYNREIVVEARYHRCQICAAIILSDKSIITHHIHRKHRTNMPQYIKEYVQKNGGKVFPTLKDYQQNNRVFELLKEEDMKKADDQGV